MSHHRNRTLPLKTSREVRSASKIKISMKGLPKDFFSQDIKEYFIGKKIRCKTDTSNN
jgi:hypothetical protein